MAGTLRLTGVGVTEKSGVGVPAGGRITPGGTNRIAAEKGPEAGASVPTFVARIVTVLAVCAVGGGGGGAV
jgi:hypothetical protein